MLRGTVCFTQPERRGTVTDKRAEFREFSLTQDTCGICRTMVKGHAVEQQFDRPLPFASPVASLFRASDDH
jgi:hypothetical protein